MSATSVAAKVKRLLKSELRSKVESSSVDRSRNVTRTTFFGGRVHRSGSIPLSVDHVFTDDFDVAGVLMEITFDVMYVVGVERVIRARVMVLEGWPSSVKKTPILRAEWDNEGLGVEPGHAQPHWHVYSSVADNVFGEVRQLLLWATPTPAASTSPEVLSLAQDIGGDSSVGGGAGDEGRQYGLAGGVPRLHLAMSAGWCGDPQGESSRELSEENAADWIVGTVKYVRHQIRYAAGKLGLRER